MITVDKIKYIIEQTQDQTAPIHQLDSRKTFDKLWGHYGNGSFRPQKTDEKKLTVIGELHELLSDTSKRGYPECRKLVKYIERLNPLMKKYLAEQKPQKALLLLRLLFLRASQYLLQMEQSNFHHQALATILYMYAFTHTYFSNHDFKGISSEQIVIRENEVFSLEMINKGIKAKKK